MHGSSDTRRLLATFAAVACLAPAAIFLMATLGRQLDPAMFEPAPAFGAIFDWFEHLGIAGLAIVLIALPTMGTALSIGLVWRSWRADAALRSDLAELASATARVLRRPAFVLSVVALVFGVCYLALVAIHAIAG